MDLVEVFDGANGALNIHIKGTVEDPLFRASNIGQALHLTDIQYDLAGLPHDSILIEDIDTDGGKQSASFITEKGLHMLLMRSRVPMAEKFRDWVFDVIKELRLRGFYDLRSREEAHKIEIELLKNKEALLQEEKSALVAKANLLEQQVERKASFLYNFKVDNHQDDENCRIKMGKTKDVPARLRPYLQTGPFGRLTYSVEVPTQIVHDAEVVLHKLMKNTGTIVKNEVYDTNVEYAKMMTRLVADLFAITDGFLSEEKDKHVGTLSKVVQLLNKELRREADGHQDLIRTTGCTREGESDLRAELLEIKQMLQNLGTSKSATGLQPTVAETESNPSTVTLPALESVYDFNRFIREGCEVGANYGTTSAVAHGRFVLWARMTNRELKEALNKFLRTRFLPTRLDDGGAVRIGFKGFRVIPYVRPTTLVPTQAEEFLTNTCVEACDSRVFNGELESNFYAWREEQEAGYEKNPAELAEVHKLLKEHYVYESLWKPESKGSEFGYYGICLKGNEDKYKRRVASTISHPIQQVEQESGTIKRKWDRVMDAAAYLGWSTAKVNYSIKKKKVIDGYVYQYATE